MGSQEPTDPAWPGGGSDVDAGVRAVWHDLLVDGNESMRRFQRMFRRLPSAPRCKLCHNPFAGFGGRLVGLAGFKPSRKNPNLCMRCCEKLPPGGIELDIAVLFADVRDSTALAERVGPSEYARLLNSFYVTATEVLVSHDAIVDKLIGDEVMALFIPGIAGPSYRRRAVEAAIDLVGTVNGQGELPVGAAVHAGSAYVGNVGGEGVLDFTALGDPVNTAARLQSHAAAGELVMASELYAPISHDHPGAVARTVDVRGREQPVEVHVLNVAAREH
jgi:adenylate cyclase